MTIVRLLVLVIVIVNYFNAKEITRLSKMSIVEKLEIDNNKIIGIGDNDAKLLYYLIQLNYPKCQFLEH